MTKLGDALRRKYKTPAAAIAALGLDAALLAADSKPSNTSKESTMTVTVKLSRAALAVQGAAMAKYALDSKSIAPLVADLTFKNFAAKKPVIAAALKGIAKDASLEDVTQMLDTLEKVEGMDDGEELTDEDYEQAAADARKRLGRDETPEERDEREEKMSGDAAKTRLGRDETPEEMEGRRKKLGDSRKARDAKRAKDNDPEKKPEMVEKKAMDAAINAVKSDAAKLAQDAVKAERVNQQAIRAALTFVQPWVGNLTGAFDSADGVYAETLSMLGRKVDGIHPSAYKAVLEAQPQPGAVPGGVAEGGRMALDSGAVDSLAKRFPHLANMNIN